MLDLLIYGNLLVLGYVWIGGAIAAGIVASTKRNSGIGFFVAGLVFGPLTLAAAMGMRAEGPACETCFEPIDTRARVCPWCGADPPFPPFGK